MCYRFRNRLPNKRLISKIHKVLKDKVAVLGHIQKRGWRWEKSQCKHKRCLEKTSRRRSKRHLPAYPFEGWGGGLQSSVLFWYLAIFIYCTRAVYINAINRWENMNDNHAKSDQRCVAFDSRTLSFISFYFILTATDAVCLAGGLTA